MYMHVFLRNPEIIPTLGNEISITTRRAGILVLFFFSLSLSLSPFPFLFFTYLPGTYLPGTYLPDCPTSHLFLCSGIRNPKSITKK